MMGNIFNKYISENFGSLLPETFEYFNNKVFQICFVNRFMISSLEQFYKARIEIVIDSSKCQFLYDVDFICCNIAKTKPNNRAISKLWLNKAVIEDVFDSYQVYLWVALVHQIFFWPGHIDFLRGDWTGVSSQLWYLGE